ncbi:MAG: sensor histidine kinase, partial [Gammaproteobacteria bacterium]
MGNRQWIAQAIGNLLGNAIQYTPIGGREFLGLSGDESQAVITVADSGAGIPESLREKAVKRFVRLDASRSTLGNSLGLSLVKAVAEHHGAALR